MKTYIINLERDIDRKEYMYKLMEENTCFDYEFIPAVDGKELTELEKNNLFDSRLFQKHNSRQPTSGEIGCTLSHRKCYEKMINANESCVLILEDDIIFKKNMNTILLKLFEIIQCKTPTIILLSGWFWFTTQKKLKNEINIANIYSGFLAHSYIINQAAAIEILSEKPFYIADDWYYLKHKKRIDIKGIKPHFVNQDWSSTFTTNTGGSEAKKIKKVACFFSLLKHYHREIIKKILQIIGHFEPSV